MQRKNNQKNLRSRATSKFILPPRKSYKHRVSYAIPLNITFHSSVRKSAMHSCSFFLPVSSGHATRKKDAVQTVLGHFCTGETNTIIGRRASSQVRRSQRRGNEAAPAWRKASPSMKILWVFGEFSMDIRMSWMFARRGISLTRGYSQFKLCRNAYICATRFYIAPVADIPWLT